MANRLAKLNLLVKDYQTYAEADAKFNGEVVSVDSSLKTNIYRFFDGEQGTLLVTVDYSKEKIIIQERGDNLNMTLELELDKEGKCVYRFDETNTLVLTSKLFSSVIKDDYLSFDYNLYNPNDMENPITRNKVEIVSEVDNLC
jgi:hypothetical protein